MLPFEIKDIRPVVAEESKGLCEDDTSLFEQSLPFLEDFVETNEVPDTKDVLEVKKELDEEDEWTPAYNEGIEKSSDDEDEPLIKKRKRKRPVSTKTKYKRIRPKKPLEEKKETLFFFPQDESLRDKSLPYQCHLCARGFEKRVPYEQHLYRHNAKSREEAWFCLLCNGLPFARMEDLKEHKKSHLSDPELTCPLCDFKCPSNMPQRHKKHMLIHKRNTVCKSCGKNYPSSKLKNNLKDHQIVDLDHATNKSHVP